MGARAGQEEERGAGERTVPAPDRPLGPRALRVIHQDLLGRPPLRAERQRWAGEGRVQFLEEHLGSEVFWRAWLDEQLYHLLLVRNFRPESERVMALPAELAEGRVGALEALHVVALSPAFDLRNPGADTFVTVVMEQFIGVEVQRAPRELALGKRMYDGRAGSFLGERGGSQADVVRIAFEDPRALRVLLAREHDRLLRRAPDRRELGAWVKRLEADPLAFVELVDEWLRSPAWDVRLEDLRPQPNRLFVRGLFVDLLDRTPEDDELRTMANALDGLADPGPLRSVLARLLLDSGRVPLPSKDEVQDPTAWIGGLFRDLLGREATPEELATFVGAFHEPDCRPETVLYALLSDPSYHRW
jgi:hypothetical protein